MSHTAITAAGRWFTRDRGKALALTSLGHAAGEALLPLTAVALIGVIGWRFSFAVSGIVLGILTVAAALWWIRARVAFRRPQARDGASATTGRGSILALPWFWANLPLYVASPMILTALIFHQGAIAADLGRSLELFAASFVAFAVMRVPGSLVGGPLIDRFTAIRLMPVHLMPAVAGIVTLALWHSAAAVFIYMALAGFANGLGGTVRSAVIAELVPADRLGAARSVTTSMMVISTAAGPAAFGLMLTAGHGAEALLWLSAAWILGASLVGHAASVLVPPRAANAPPA